MPLSSSTDVVGLSMEHVGGRRSPGLLVVAPACGSALVLSVNRVSPDPSPRSRQSGFHG